jgi:CheY-like chemotaxis protein
MGKNELRRVLIVDDEPLILYALSKALHRDGVEVTAVGSGEEALIEIYGCSYDICFLDIHLGELSGLTVMKKVKELCPQTLIAIMTTSELDEDSRGMVKGAADYFITKPFDIDEMRAIVKSAGGPPQGLKSEVCVPAETTITDIREHARRPFRTAVNFGLIRMPDDEVVVFTMRGATIDVSDGGLGMWSRSLLDPGSVMRFDNELEGKSGVVRWNAAVAAMYAFRVGVQFLDP